MNRKNFSVSAGGAVVWVILACAIVVVLVFLVAKQRRPKPVARVIAEATPIPATPIPATPPPVVKATPMPAPVVVATPTPKPVATPPSLDLATVAQTPALWPAQVALVQPRTFPLWLNGRAVGEVKAPAGLVLRLLRVAGQQVEVEYQGQRQIVPAMMTDLMTRALAASRSTGSVLSESPKMAAAEPMSPATPTTPADPAAPTAPAEVVQFTPPRPVENTPTMKADRIDIDVVRQKASRAEGGESDDKKDQIALKVKLTNTDTTVAAENMKGQICVLAESILDRTAVKLLQKQDFAFSLPARGTHEFVTEEVESAYNTTGAKSGYRYEGWLLRIHDSAGNLVVEKSSARSFIKNASKVVSVEVGSSFDRNTMAPKTPSR